MSLGMEKEIRIQRDRFSREKNGIMFSATNAGGRIAILRDMRFAVRFARETREMSGNGARIATALTPAVP